MGSGYKQFTAGAVLTASEVNNYLMEQSVMTFAGSAARGSAIGTANYEEGMTSYLQDTDKLEVYNGTNWVSVAPTSTQGLTLINTTSFSGVSSQSVNDVFSTNFDNYRILVDLTSSAVGALGFRLRVSGTDATGANYNTQRMVAYSSTVAAARYTNQTSHEVNATSTNIKLKVELEVTNPFLAQVTNILTRVNYNYDQTVLELEQKAANHLLSTSYTGFTLFPSAGTITGNVSVYGYNK